MEDLSIVMCLRNVHQSLCSLSRRLMQSLSLPEEEKKTAEEKRQVCVFRLCLLFPQERLLRLSQRSGLSLDVSDRLSCVPRLQT